MKKSYYLLCTQQVYDGPAFQDNQMLNSNSGKKEVQYATINFSLLKRNGRKQESTKTEYAEIKKAVKEQYENAEEEDELLEAKEDEMVVELEMKYREPENEEGGDEAVYSNVNDIINEI